MNAPNHLSPEERKRIRDRHSQRKHREKRDLHTRQLEELVAFCQRNHDTTHIQYLGQRVLHLEAENNLLLKERDKLSDFVHQMQKSLSYLFPHLRDQGSHEHADSPANGVHEQLVAPHFGIPKRTDAVILLGGDVAPTRGGSQQVPRPDQIRLTVPDPKISSQPASGAQIPDSELHEAVAGPPLHHMLSRSGPRLPLNVPDSILLTSLAAESSGSGTTCRMRPGGGYAGVQLMVVEEAPTSGKEIPAEFASPETLCSSQPFGVSTRMPSLNTPDDLSKRNTEQAIRNAPKVPDWLCLPAVSNSFDESRGHSGWLKVPHAVAMSPDVPAPEDILFGSRKNFLANEIHNSMRKIHLAEPERLAIGWLGYAVNKWRVAPTKESFGRMPSFLRPTPEQISSPHPSSFDVVPWPGLRNALIKQHVDDEMHNIMDLISCCIKIRWPWGEEILEVKEDNSRQIKDEFYKTLMSLEGWGMTKEFIGAYPHLFENLDVEAIQIKIY